MELRVLDARRPRTIGGFRHILLSRLERSTSLQDDVRVAQEYEERRSVKLRVGPGHFKRGEGHEVIILRSSMNIDEEDEWLDKNVRSHWFRMRSTDDARYLFEDKFDAMMLKLRFG